MHNMLLAATAATAIVISTPAYAQSATTFTYQGQLVESGTPADGLYEFEVRLLNNLAVQIGFTETPVATVTEGVFTMDLDFGPAAFDGSPRFLEISVRSLMAGGAFTTLSPNHPVTSAPIAQFALAGNEGPVGPQGIPGADGAPGAEGAQGLQGDPGTNGAQGIQGDPGNNGAQGPQGNPGNDGTPGDSHWALSGSDTYYNTGKVGIGTSNPEANLHINADGTSNIFRVQKNLSTKMLVNGNGGISLGGFDPNVPNGDTLVIGNLTVSTGTSSSAFKLSVNGSAGKPGGGSWSIFSDKRLKKNITSMTGSLDTISALRPVNFEYKSEDHFSYLPGTQRGFIAQEVQQVIPQWVHTADDGYFYLDQTGYEALIVDAIQELRAEKDQEISKLQAQVDRLEQTMYLLLNNK